MPKLLPYSSQISPFADSMIGYRTPRASASDFLTTAGGDETGKALARAGDIITKTLSVQKQKEEDDELAKAQLAVAQARTDYLDTYNQRVGSATLGDEALPDTVRTELRDNFRNLSNSFKTDKARQYVMQHGETTAAQFFGQALTWQRQTAGEAAVEYHKSTVEANKKFISENPNALDFVLGGHLASIENGEGRYKVWNQHPDKKQSIIQSLSDEYRFAAAYSKTMNDSGYREAVLQTVKIEQTKEIPGIGKPIEDFGAEYVKPYNQAKIQSRIALYTKPSSYDQAFKDAGEKYGIDWRELKLRATVESGLDQKAVNKNSGAIGLMQFMPETAKGLGIDPSDPVQAIDGAARLMSQFKGDTATMDLNYYGGPDQKKWGKNTKQYAANMEALRYATGIKEVPPTVTMPDISKANLPPEFKQLPPEKQLQLMNMAERISKEQTNIAYQNIKAMTEDHIAAVRRGDVVTPIPPHQLAVGEQKEPGLTASYNLRMEAAAMTHRAANMHPSQQAAWFAEQEKPRGTEPPGMFAKRQKMLEMVRKDIMEMNAERNKNPVESMIKSEFGKHTGDQAKMLVDANGQPITNGEVLAVKLSERKMHSQSYSETTGAPFQLVSPSEGKAYGAIIRGMPPDQATNFMLQLRNNTDPVTFRQFTRSMGDDSKIMSHVGYIMSSQLKNRDEVAKWTIAGMSYMRDKKIAGSDLQLSKMDDVLTEWVSDRMGKDKSAKLVISPEQAEVVKQIATSAFIGYKTANGQAFNLDLDATKNRDNRESMKAILDQVIGKPAKVGDTGVLPPLGMAQDAFVSTVRDKMRAHPQYSWGTYSLKPMLDERSGTDGRYHIIYNGRMTSQWIDVNESSTPMAKEEARLLGRAPAKTPPVTKQTGASVDQDAQTWNPN